MENQVKRVINCDFLYNVFFKCKYHTSFEYDYSNEAKNNECIL